MSLSSMRFSMFDLGDAENSQEEEPVTPRPYSCFEAGQFGSSSFMDESEEEEELEWLDLKELP